MPTPNPLDFWKDLAIILAGVVALITFFFGVLEFVRQGRQHNASNFVQMRRRFLETETFRHILNLLATDSPELEDLPIQDRRNFIGFFEEVALMVNSKMIRAEVAHYMFGYSVGLADRSKHLWIDLDRQSIYWTLFRDFAKLMKKFEQSPVLNEETLRF